MNLERYLWTAGALLIAVAAASQWARAQGLARRLAECGEQKAVLEAQIATQNAAVRIWEAEARAQMENAARAAKRASEARNEADRAAKALLAGPTPASCAEAAQVIRANLDALKGWE